MSPAAYAIVPTLCALALLGAAKLLSRREGPRFFGSVVVTFSLCMLVLTHVLDIGWPK